MQKRCAVLKGALAEERNYASDGLWVKLSLQRWISTMAAV